MNMYSRALVKAHGTDLRREAKIARDRAVAREAARENASQPPRAVTLRLGLPADVPALKRLAALDSAELPAAPLLLAEVSGEPWAALSLTDKRAIADPFHRTAPLVALLRKCAEPVILGRSSRLRRLSEAGRLPTWTR